MGRGNLPVVSSMRAAGLVDALFLMRPHDEHDMWEGNPHFDSLAGSSG